MARKRKNSSDGGINLDSLMDALTNVVAVLILVLLLVSVDAGRKVQQFLDDLKPATPEEIIASKQRIEELKKEREEIEVKLKEDPPSPEQIEEEKRQIALLEKSVEESKVALADIDKLRELEKTVRKERDDENEANTAIQVEISELEALLDQTPTIKPDTPTVVSIPNNRPIPSDANVYYAIAAKERLHIIDPVTPLKIFDEEFKKNRQEWLAQRIQQKGADRYIYDGRKIAKYFETFDWKNPRGQKIEIRTYPTWNRLELVITPDLEKGGTPTEELSVRGSEFFNAAIALKQDFKAVLMFYVNTDSFQTYLEARALADKANIAAGWEINGSREYKVRLTEIEVKRLEDPPPPPANPAPRPPGPPPVKPKLD